jgi:signal transduction histidine kinase
MVIIEIADTGSGIPEEIIDRVFDPFFTTKEVGEGTGLGLSIAYGIITKHRGRMTVKSKVGQGSVFTIKIPTVESPKEI